MDDPDATLPPEQALAVLQAPASGRGALEALLRLDATLAAIVRAAREPLIGQMRLTWWYEALVALDTGPAPAQPVLQAVETAVLPRGVAGRTVAVMVDGWEALLDSAPLDADRLSAYAHGRGAGLFAAAGAALGHAPGDPLDAGGRGWALADLAQHLSDPREAGMARAMAEQELAAAFEHRWSRPVRALGALTVFARADLLGIPAGSPRRLARLLRHRITGR